MAEQETKTAAEAPETNGNGRMGKIVLAIVLLASVIGGVIAWRYYAVRESTDNAQIEGDIVPVAARVGGTVVKVHVSENQYVEAGALLVELDPRDYEVALLRAQAEVADASANAQAARTNVPIASATTSSQLQTAQATVAAASDSVEAARAGLRRAEAAHQQAATDLARYKALIEKEEIPRMQYDAAVTAEQTARAAVDAARAQLAAAQSQVRQAQAQERGASTAPQQVAVSQARAGAASASHQKAQAALEQAKLNLGYTQVRAAKSGYVSKKNVQLGQIVQPGQPLMALVPLDEVWVVANFKETQLKDVRPGQPVEIHVDAYDRAFRGKVESIGGATGAKFSLLPPENASGNFVKVVQRIPVKIVFEKGQDSEHLLRPGMSVEPTVLTK